MNDEKWDKWTKNNRNNITISTNIKMFNNSVSVFSVFFGFTILHNHFGRCSNFENLRLDAIHRYNLHSYCICKHLFAIYFCFNASCILLQSISFATLSFCHTLCLSSKYLVNRKAPSSVRATLININTLKIICISVFHHQCVFYFLTFLLLVFRLDFNADASSDSDETSR